MLSSRHVINIPSHTWQFACVGLFRPVTRIEQVQLPKPGWSRMRECLNRLSAETEISSQNIMANDYCALLLYFSSHYWGFASSYCERKNHFQVIHVKYWEGWTLVKSRWKREKNWSSKPNKQKWQGLGQDSSNLAHKARRLPEPSHEVKITRQVKVRRSTDQAQAMAWPWKWRKAMS